MKAALICSFCGASHEEVHKLIAGPQVYICDQCVDQIDSAMEADEPELAPRMPSEMLRRLDESVVGRHAGKRALVAALRRRDLAAGLDAPTRASRILLVGPRGSGKTFLGHALVATAGCPSYAGDATCLSESGYVGADVETLVYGLLASANHRVDRAQSGLLYVDAIEKLRSRQPIGARDIAGGGVQRELCRLLDGETLQVPPSGGARHPQQDLVRVDTSNIVVVAAFRTEGWAPEPGQGDGDLRDALCRAGLLDAFVARFDRVIALPPLVGPELDAILRSRGGPLDEANATIVRLGGSLQLDPPTLQIMGAAAERSGDGAWALRRIVWRMLDEVILALCPAQHWHFNESHARRWLD